MGATVILKTRSIGGEVTTHTVYREPRKDVEGMSLLWECCSLLDRSVRDAGEVKIERFAYCERRGGRA